MFFRGKSVAITAAQMTLVYQAETSVTICAHPVGGIFDDSATYQWYRSTTQGFTPGGGNILSGKTSRTLTDTGLTSNTVYYYVLRATSGMDTVDYPEFDVKTLGAAVGLPTVDATSGIDNDNNTLNGQATWNHTCGGTNRTLYVTLAGILDPDVSKVAYYNGLPMMPLGYSARPGGFYLHTWKMVNPPLGEHAVLIKWSHVAGSYDSFGAAISFKDTNTIENHGEVIRGLDTGTTASATVDYETGWLTVGIVYGGSDLAEGSGLTNVYVDTRGGSDLRIATAEQTGLSWSQSSGTWAVTGFAIKPVGSGSTPPIPLQSHFELRMIQGADGQATAALAAKTHFDTNANPNASEVVTIWAEGGGYSWYYAGPKVLYDVGDYLGTADYDEAAAAQLYVRDRAYEEPTGYYIGGHTWEIFTDSATRDYENTSDANDLVIVEGLRDVPPYSADGATSLETALLSRENAYHLMSHLNGDVLGITARTTKKNEVIANAKDHMVQWFDTLAWVGQDQQFSPFMVGLTAEALIRLHAITGDSEIPTLIKAACDYLWNDAWHTDTLGMIYQLNPDASALQDGGRGTTGSPTLNNLIAKMYAWLAVQTGDQAQMDRADWLFAGSAFNGNYVYGKQFNQAHWLTLGSTGTLAMRAEFYGSESMASGNTLITLHPYDNEPPSSNYATLDTRNGHPVLDFDAGTDESAIFSAILPRNYAGGGLTVYLHWSGTSATSGDVVWNAAFERIGEGQQDMDADGFASAQAVTATAPGTTGHVDIAAIAFTDGAQVDSIAVGELFRLKITRDADNGSDTMTGDAELRAIEIKET